MRVLTQQEVWDDLLNRLHTKFVSDGNPLRAWQAFAWSRQHSRPLPEWVAAYFDGVSAALLAGTPPTGALGFATKGGHSKWRQLADEHRDAEIHSVIDALMTTEREDLPDDYHHLDWLFEPPRRGKLDRICDHVAADMRRPNAAITLDGSAHQRPLSAKRLRAIYFAYKSSRKKIVPTTR